MLASTTRDGQLCLWTSSDPNPTTSVTAEREMMAGSSSGPQFNRAPQEPMDSNGRPSGLPPPTTAELSPYKPTELDVKSNVAQVKLSPEGEDDDRVSNLSILKLSPTQSRTLRNHGLGWPANAFWPTTAQDPRAKEKGVLEDGGRVSPLSPVSTVAWL